MTNPTSVQALTQWEVEARRYVSFRSNMGCFQHPQFAVSRGVFPLRSPLCSAGSEDKSDLAAGTEVAT